MERGLEKQREARQSWPPRREESWALEEGAQHVLEGQQMLRRQECIVAFSVHRVVFNVGGSGLGLEIGNGFEMHVEQGILIRKSLV